MLTINHGVQDWKRTPWVPKAYCRSLSKGALCTQANFDTTVVMQREEILEYCLQADGGVL